MPGSLKLDETEIFKFYPWRTNFPAGDYQKTASRFKKGDDGKKVLRALAQYEADFCEGQRIHSNIHRQKAAQCTVFDLFRDRTLDKYRSPMGKVEDPVLRPVVYLMTGWKVVELMLLSKEDGAESDVQEDESEEGEPADWSCPRMSTYPFKAKVRRATSNAHAHAQMLHLPDKHWKLDDIEDTRSRCRKALQDPTDLPVDLSSIERELDSKETITSSLATTYIKSRKKRGASAIIENVHGAALCLRLLTAHGVINVESIESAFWNRLCGGEYQTLQGDEKLWLGKKLLGPLQGAVFIDPVFLLNTTGKAVGSYRPPLIQRLNKHLWDLVCDIARGTIASSQISEKLSQLLGAPCFVGATQRYKHFYRPRGNPHCTPISEVDAPAQVGSKRSRRKQAKKTKVSDPPSRMKRIKEFDNHVPSLFDKNVYNGASPEDRPIVPRGPKKARDRKNAAAERAWANERDIAAGIQAKGSRYDHGGTSSQEGATQVGELGEGDEEDQEESENEGRRESEREVKEGGGGGQGEGVGEVEVEGSEDKGSDRWGDEDEDANREIKQQVPPLKLKIRQQLSHPVLKEAEKLTAYMKGQFLPNLLNRAHLSGPTSSRVELGEQVQRTESVGNLMSVRDAFGVGRGRMPHFHANEHKAFWDALVDRFANDEQEARSLELTMSKAAWIATCPSLERQMVVIRPDKGEEEPVNPLDEFKEALRQLAPMDVPIPVYDLSVKAVSGASDSRRACTLNDVVRNSELHPRSRKAIITGKIPAGDSVCSSNRLRHLEQMIWAETNVAPDSFHDWEVSPHGCPLFLEVLAGELTVFACWDVEGNYAVNTKRPLGMEPVPPCFTLTGKRLTKGCYLIVPPSSTYVGFVTADAVWRGGSMLDWSSMLGGLVETINFTISGNFTTAFQTLDFNEVLVRAMAVFHRKIQQERNSEDDQEDPLLPPMKEQSDWVQLAAFFCRIALLNVFAVETYMGPVDSLGHLSLPWDLNRIPLPQRLSYAYARGLLQDILDSATQTQDGMRTLRDDVYLPLLCSTISRLRSDFNVRHGKRGSGVGGLGFWEPPERKAMFHTQLDAVATRAFGSTLEGRIQAQGTLGRFEMNIHLDEYDLRGSRSSNPNEELLLESGMTERDIQFFWSALCRERSGSREGSISNTEIHSKDVVMEEALFSDGEPDRMDTS
ncbi:hypothetical protein FA13DRAFT_1794622 [Coprinellus micaceus]|uniref:JmjC domain-containing protein n=1 Tax=Coprinellus micaceus TaxID=71717 RepID=A0A4Y7T0K2_COPMI|nr:hypothetical protein FA13DRAFT_1794622 [Coprinellus micaceus]